MKPRGVTLAETVIAVFILVSAMVVFFTLLHTMLRYGVRAQQRAMAAMAAEKKLEEIREWALDVTNFRTNWGTYTAKTFTDPTFPDMTIATDVEDALLFSPTSQMESGFADPRALQRSAKKVRVRVSWPEDGGRPVEVLTLVGDPPREPDPNLSIDPAAPSTLNPDGTFSVTATAYDTSGQPIEDIFFVWYSMPSSTDPGNGTITSTRDGRTATFAHRYSPGLGTTTAYVDGAVRAGATAYYRGRELRGASNVVQLLP